MEISVVVPVYNTAIFLHELISRLELTLLNITNQFEVVLVDDGSPDNSWEEIEIIVKQKPFVKGIKLSRNFGQHYAISAGLMHAIGNWVVVMDGDLQDQPEEIIRLYDRAAQGFYSVLASRERRNDSFFKKFSSQVFYRVLTYLTGTNHDETVANFGIYNSQLISQINHMPESIRYFPTMVQWVGFKTCKITVEHASRKEGKSSYSYKRLFNLALNIMLAYSDKPLRLTVKFGIVISALSFLFACVTMIRWLSGQIEVLGYTSLIISIWFVGGCILVTLGIVGLYIGKIFEGVKNRPLYIVEKIT